MAISITSIVKQSAKFNLISVVSLVIQIPNQLIIGMFLVPSEYGIISFVTLWSLYAGLINPGMLSAGQREIPYLIGKKKEEQSIKVQNITISSYLLYNIFPFIAILCASFFYSNKMIKIGLILTAFFFIVNRFAICWSSINFIKQRFTIVAIGRLIGALLTPIIIISSIFWLGIYSVLIAPLISVVFIVIYYFTRGPIGYRFEIEWTEVIRLIKIGFIFSLSGAVFYVYRMADRTIIAYFLSLRDLGLFTFAMGFIMFGMNFLADFGRVLEPILWEHSGKVKNLEDSFINTDRMAIYMALLTAMIIPLVQVGYIIVVNLIVPNYIESVSLFLVLSNLLYLGSMATIPSVILHSVVVNKQAVVTGVYGISVGINIVLDLLMIYLGYGIKAIAFVTIISQSIVTFTSYYLAQKYMFSLPRVFVRFMISISAPFSISILFSIFHGFLVSTILSLWVFGLVSVTIQIMVWSIILNVFYQDYFPRDKIFGFIEELYGLWTAEIRKKLKALRY